MERRPGPASRAPPGTPIFPRLNVTIFIQSTRMNVPIDSWILRSQKEPAKSQAKHCTGRVHFFFSQKRTTKVQHCSDREGRDRGGGGGGEERRTFAPPPPPQSDAMRCGSSGHAAHWLSRLSRLTMPELREKRGQRGGGDGVGHAVGQKSYQRGGGGRGHFTCESEWESMADATKSLCGTVLELELGWAGSHLRPALPALSYEHFPARNYTPIGLFISPRHPFPITAETHSFSRLAIFSFALLASGAADDRWALRLIWPRTTQDSRKVAKKVLWPK
ncbi:hypothetical protein IE81DRAFT_40475 [Ceraceosorus guamensis]|uniref:Uncharacterized protein n=1 Tax=Ceraceosorus guamensis TaxID=1522189 RepID=A0A316VQC6_9BASI|nr:hypothetical protein IE81DRAFT_40475 [Ceraceosorus guamensis]PWN39268.1 hypothetical protein IE81DRAFT_40475 [Ceraceosorus guamensis]